MSLSVIIYSPDNIRGKIILKTIHLEKIESVLCSSYSSVEDEVKKRVPDVTIFDTKNNFWGELDFLKKLPQTTRIILAEPQDISFLKNTDLRNDLFTPEPFHPEFILSLVKAILESRLKKKYFKSSLSRLLSAASTGRLLLVKSFPVFLILLAGVIGGYIYWCLSTLPNIERLEVYRPYEASKL